MSYAQQMGVEHSGTKAVLVDRIHSTLSTDTTTLAVTVGGRQVPQHAVQQELQSHRLEWSHIMSI